MSNGKSVCQVNYVSFDWHFQGDNFSLQALYTIYYLIKSVRSKLRDLTCITGGSKVGGSMKSFLRYKRGSMKKILTTIGGIRKIFWQLKISKSRLLRGRGRSTKTFRISHNFNLAPRLSPDNKFKSLSWTIHMSWLSKSRQEQSGSPQHISTNHDLGAPYRDANNCNLQSHIIMALTSS